MNAILRTPPTLADTTVFQPSEVVDRALRLAGGRLRNVARLERSVSGEPVAAAVPVAELSQSLSELLIAAGRRLDAPRPGSSRWLRVVAQVVGSGLELAVEHGAGEGTRTAIHVPLAGAISRSA
jgi:hypothetical protein